MTNDLRTVTIITYTRHKDSTYTVHDLRTKILIPYTVHDLRHGTKTLQYAWPKDYFHNFHNTLITYAWFKDLNIHSIYMTEGQRTKKNHVEKKKTITYMA